MKKLTLIFIIFICISCKNESKINGLSKDEFNAEIVNSNSSKAAETTTNALRIVEPVKWTTKTNKISESDYELIIVANIEEDYHLYSQKVPDNGPLPTVFIFEDSDDYELIGSPSEEEGHTAYDSTFEMDIKSFKNTAFYRASVGAFEHLENIQDLPKPIFI